VTHDLEEEGQLVVYDASGSKLVVLNDIGAAIYFLIDGKRSSQDIGRFLADTLPQGVPESCQSDVEAFLQQLESQGVVSWAQDTSRDS
jgi:uncharacterized protein YpbB